MTVDLILDDAEFGHLYIRTNARAKRYVFRPAKDGSPACGVLITVPIFYDKSDVLRSVEQMRPQLRTLIEKAKRTAGQPSSAQPSRIDWDFRIESDCLLVSLVRGTSEQFYVKHLQGQPATMQLICPPDCDFTDQSQQEWLEKVLIEGIRKHAKLQLIPRLRVLAEEHAIALRDVKINNSKGHWGSCVRHTERRLLGRKSEFYNVNLSLFTLLLPLSVQRLVLLHELCHTHHMDHSAAFHHELDHWLGGQEQDLEHQLKQYTTSVFSFQKKPMPQ